MKYALVRVLFLVAILAIGLRGMAEAADSVLVDIIAPGDTLWSQDPSEIAIYIENDDRVLGFSLGFIISSPDGATLAWDAQPNGFGTSAAVTIVPGSRMDTNWDLVFAVTEYSMNGIPPDSLLIGGCVMMGDGLLPGPLEHSLSIHFTADDIPPGEVRTICVDSAFMPPAGQWVFQTAGKDVVYPAFSGQICFPVKRCGFDDDNDGVCDFVDNCPGVYNPAQSDPDDDGLGDLCDNCPNEANQDQSDSDVDGVGDLCDNCPQLFNDDQADTDDDGHGDLCDNCPELDNPDQADGDGDGVGSLCDNCPQISNSNQEDDDSDGVGNVCDNCPAVPNASQEDSDQDGIGDACEGGGPGYQCGDINADSWINVADVVYLINFIFKNGPPPCEPE